MEPYVFWLWIVITMAVVLLVLLAASIAEIRTRGRRIKNLLDDFNSKCVYQDEMQAKMHSLQYERGQACAFVHAMVEEPRLFLEEYTEGERALWLRLFESDMESASVDFRHKQDTYEARRVKQNTAEE